MTAKTNTGAIPFEFGQKTKDSRVPAANRPPGKNFNMLIIGNFLGNNLSSPSGSTKPIKIDRDNLEEVMATLQPSLSLPIGNNSASPEGNPQTVNMTFTNLDEFHPDYLYQHIELFSEFRTLRRKLNKDSSFAAAAEKMDQWISVATEAKINTKTTPSATSNGQAADNAPAEGLLDSILGGSNSSGSVSSEADRLVTSLIQDAVAAYATPAPNPQKQHYIEALDHTISSTMAALLHHPEFQALEAAWRGLDMMTRRIETDRQLTLRMLSQSKKDLLIDLAEHRDATQSNFSKLVYDASALPTNDDRWSTIIGLYDFSDTKNDALMLGILAKVMANADTPFIAAGSPSLVNCSSYFY